MTRRSRRWPITLPVCADFLPYFLPSRPEPTANDKPRQGGAIPQMVPLFFFTFPGCPYPSSAAHVRSASHSVGFPGLAHRGRTTVFDALCDLAVGADLHCLGDRHGLEAE